MAGLTRVTFFLSVKEENWVGKNKNCENKKIFLSNLDSDIIPANLL